MDVVERSRDRAPRAAGDPAPDPRARTFVASGRSFPDALAAGPAAVSLGGVLVLGAGTTDDNEDIYEVLAPVAGEELEVLVVGGTAAISEDFELGWPYE